MEKIFLKKGCGKTTKLITKSASDGVHIVCKDLKEVNRILNYSIKMRLSIPTPITYLDFLLQRYEGKNINGFLIDDVDELVKSISHIPIHAITMTP